MVMASGDISAAYSVVALSGLARATFDPKKNVVPTGGDKTKDGFVKPLRDDNGAVLR